MARITITIPRDSSKGTKVHVEGHAGPGCQHLTEGLLGALGTTLADATTEEFDQAEVRTRQQQHLGG